MKYHLDCISLTSGKSIPIPKQTFLCLGNFDGVHLAHRELLSMAAKKREQSVPDAQVGVFCFRELPARYLEPCFQGKLCSNEERLNRFRECGMEFVILADFCELRNLSAEDYIQSILIEECNAVAVSCGYNHRFGKGGQGSVSLLRERFENDFFLQEPVFLEGTPISSSRIRDLLQMGCPEEATNLMKYPYAVTASVLHGKALGRQMGTPTVNQRFPEDAVIPKHGVYVTECLVDGKSYRGVTNVGIRPTVDADRQVNFETYLLDFSGNLYDKQMTVRFLKFIREEKRFDSVEALWAQINEDIETARISP